jgi:Regulator of chromosome condensation (RCC1) repeat
MFPSRPPDNVSCSPAGPGHTVALKNDGSVVWWRNFDQETVPVAAQSGVTAIAAGGGHSVVLKTDGTLVAWGHGESGQVTETPIANPPHFAIASPVTLGGQVLSGVAAIAAGWNHTVALKNDGTVVAWGYNIDGEVTGTHTTEQPYSAIASPVTLGGQVLSGVTAIAAGPSHTVALIGGVPLLPSLKARPNGNELILSWPTNAPGFALQSTLDLTPPVNWLDSTSVPAVIGAHFTLTNTVTGGARLYRLRKR